MCFVSYFPQYINIKYANIIKYELFHQTFPSTNLMSLVMLLYILLQLL